MCYSFLSCCAFLSRVSDLRHSFQSFLVIFRSSFVLSSSSFVSITDDDLSKLLKKFPEVLGCNLEEELKGNVKILEEQSCIKGNSLRKLLLRNPKFLGYNVDCKGDYIAQCTRCWARF
ncbi:hypothetical protein D0Y65_026446 [Glycine soja]|uniref:Uncharacterized protein n=1 Tax=Glycine soja TaxID=3848 RepID=A0A445IK11_GLYSO|nr:hypothetical protein D0Y65_026446 [Glycine soja]